MVVMKKSIFMIGCLALLMAGCNKIEHVEAPVDDPAMVSPEHLTIDIRVNQEGDTRAVKKAWEVGDKIYVAFDHYFTNDETATSSETVYYLTLTYNGYSWDSQFSDVALENYLKNRTSGALAAVYCSAFVPQFRFHRGSDTRGNASILAENYVDFYGFFLHADDVPYSVSNGKLTATLEMSVYPNDVYFYLDDEQGLSADRLTLKCTNLTINRFKGILRYRTSDTQEGSPVVDYSRPTQYGGAIRAARYPGGPDHGQGKYFCGYLKENLVGVPTEYVIQIIDNNSTPADETDDVIYTLTKTATLWGKDAIELPSLNDTSKWVKSWVVNSGTVNGHNWVRMGDGTKWATENVTVVPGSISFDQKYYYSWSKANWTTLWEGWRVPSPEEWRSLGRGYHTFEHVYVGGYIASRVRASNTGQQLYLPGWGALDEDLQSLVALKEYDPVTYQPIYEINPYGFYWTNYNNEASGGTHYAFITDVEGSPVRILSDEADGSWDASYMAVRLVVDE